MTHPLVLEGLIAYGPERSPEEAACVWAARRTPRRERLTEKVKDREWHHADTWGIQGKRPKKAFVVGSGIYQITNQINGKRYVGSAVSLKKRWREHLSALRHDRHSNRHLQGAFDKYGEAAFVFSILESVEEPAALIGREQHHLDTVKPEYNMAPTAGSQLGYRHTDETKRKMSESQKGHYHTEETKRKVGEASRGRHPSAEARRKMSLAKRGERHPRYGKPCSAEHKRNLSKAMKHRALSVEVRRRMSEGQKRRWRRVRAARQTR